MKSLLTLFPLCILCGCGTTEEEEKQDLNPARTEREHFDKLYSPQYVVNEYPKTHVLIFGEVNTPGHVELGKEGKIEARELLFSHAAGVTRLYRGYDLLVKRNNGERLAIDWKELNQKEGLSIFLYPGDIIYVPSPVPY